MKEFIYNIESCFHDKCINILNKGIELLLTPLETIDILYFYLKKEQSNIDKDCLMAKLADISLSELIILFKKIKTEVFNFLNLK